MIRILCPVSLCLALLIPSLLNPVARSDEAPPLRSLIGHISSSQSVVFSPDGKLLASGGKAGQIIVWETASWKKRHTIHTNYGECNGVAVSPDSRLLASVKTDEGKEVAIHGMESGRLLHTMEHRQARAIAFSPDGKLIATGCNHKLIKLWDANTWELKQTLTGHPGQITALAFSPDSKTLAGINYVDAYDQDNPVLLWDVETGKQKRVLANRGQVFTVAFSPDGKWVASI